MKLTIYLSIVLAYVAAVSALPALLEQQDDQDTVVWEPQDSLIEETHGLRLKRATCDLGSFQSKWFTPNHSLCALHCIGRGKKGGSCKNTICYCRN